MKNFTIRVASTKDVPQLVALANQYTYQNLPEPDRQTGFLTGTFTEAVILNMIHSAPCVVAHDQEVLAGFIINTKLPAHEYPPLVQQIISLLPTLRFRNLPADQYTYFFYGPVLVAKDYRQQGLLQLMFRKCKDILNKQYEIGLAFIDQANETSLRVHIEHLGWEVMGNIIFHNRAYTILAFSII